jgi:DNA polymerase I-like protein with 3'-5' exonuclease and polymerase domains
VTRLSPDYQVVGSGDEARSLLASLLQQGLVCGIDIETGYDGEFRPDAQKHPEEGFIVSFQITNANTWGRFLPVRFDSYPNLDAFEVAEALWPLASAGLLTAWNANFEGRFMSRYFKKYLADHKTFGPQVLAAHHGNPEYCGYFPWVSDPMLEVHATGRYHSLRLKENTKETFGYEMTEIGMLFAMARGGKDLTSKEMSGIRFNALDLAGEHRNAIVEYGCDDAVYELWHHHERYPLIKDSFIYQLEMALLPITCQMMDEGLVLDWPRMAETAVKAGLFRDKMQTEIQDDLTVLLEAAGITDPDSVPCRINLQSSQQLVKVLYEQLQMPVHRRTPRKRNKKGEMVGGTPSTDADTALAPLIKDWPVVQRIIDFRSLGKLKGTYLEPYAENYSYCPCGRTHPNWLQAGVPAGRYACAAWPVQQAPKIYNYTLTCGDKFFHNFRDNVRAPDGWYILGYDYCVAPDTRICTSDLRWVRADSLQSGDELVGFDEFRDDEQGNGGGRKARLRRSEVQKVARIKRPCYRVTTSDGRQVIASSEHLWVEVGTSKGSTRVKGDSWRGSTYVPAHKRKWVATENLIPGKSRLCWWVQPWDELDSEQQYDAGWLAGFADGEGWIFGKNGRGHNVGLGQKPGLAWDQALAVCKRLGYSLSQPYTGAAGVERRYLDYQSSVQFLAQCRPVRLGRRSAEFWDGRQTYGSQHTRPVLVTSVEFLGEREVIALRTSTHTFIAEGFLSHNCQVERRVLAGEAQDPALLEAFRSGVDIHKRTAADLLGIPIEEVTKEQRQMGKTLGFGMDYGLVPDSLADRMGIAPAQAHDLHARYFEVYARLEPWKAQNLAQAKLNGFVLTGGFKRRVTIWEFQSSDRRTYSEGERLAGNAPIQGGAADYMKVAMVRAIDALRQAGLQDWVRLVMNMHDALYFYVRQDVKPLDVIRVLQKAVVWTAPFLSHWPPMKAEWCLGTRWGSVLDCEVHLDSDGIPESMTVEQPKPKAPEPEPESYDRMILQVAADLPPAPDPDLALAAPSYTHVIIHAAQTPGPEDVSRLADMLRTRPGQSVVILRTPVGDIQVATACGMVTSQHPEAALILGQPVRMTVEHQPLVTAS